MNSYLTFYILILFQISATSFSAQHLSCNASFTKQLKEAQHIKILRNHRLRNIFVQESQVFYSRLLRGNRYFVASSDILPFIPKKERARFSLEQPEVSAVVYLGETKRDEKASGRPLASKVILSLENGRRIKIAKDSLGILFFAQPNFQQLRNYEKGDFLSLSVPKYQTLNVYNDKKNMVGQLKHEHGSFAGVFQESLSDQLDLVTIRLPENQAEYQVLTPKQFLTNIPNSNSEKLGTRLKSLLEEKLSFVPEEPVRFRHPKNRQMLSGKLIELSNEKAVVKQGTNRFEISPKSLYKRGYSTVTKSFNPVMLETSQFSYPSKDLLKILEASAKYTSLDSFLKKTSLEQIESISELVSELIMYDPIVENLEGGLVATGAGVVCKGIGLCRHQASLMQAILSEWGLEASPHYVFPQEGRPGHVWLETVINKKSNALEQIFIDTTLAEQKVFLWSDLNGLKQTDLREHRDNYFYNAKKEKL